MNITDNGLVPLSETSDMMSLANLMSEGAVNLDALRNLTNAIRQVEPVITSSAQTVRQLPPAHLEQVSKIVETTRDAIVGADDALTHAGPLLDDLPSLLGENGQEKKYLIVASNNAELHAAGGYVGTVGILSAVDGNLTMGDFNNVRSALPVDSVSAGATEEEIRVFGERADTHHGDHNVIPDFTRVGQLYYNIWETANAEQLDGVIGVDPVFLQRVLKLIGGVNTSYDVKVDGTNAASVILNECLFWWDNKTCDDFYNEVASKSFKRLLKKLGSVDTMKFLDVVASSSEEGRCNAWVRDEAIEEHIKATGYGWETPHDATKPVVGVYASDASTSKAAYYLSLDTQVGKPQTNEDGSKSYAVASVFKHNLDRSLVFDELPGYIKTQLPKVIETRSVVEILENLTLIAPEGGRIENVRATYSDSVEPAPEFAWYECSYQGLNAWRGDMFIDAGESCTITYTVVTSPEASEPLRVRQVPVVPHDVRGD